MRAKQVFPKKTRKFELYSPRGICHLGRDIREELHRCSWNGTLKCVAYCKECQLGIKNLEKWECENTSVYDLLRTGIVGGPEQVLTRYHEKDITRIRSYVYGEKSKLTKDVIDYDALYPYCSGDIMPFGKDTLVVKKSLMIKNKFQSFQGVF